MVNNFLHKNKNCEESVWVFWMTQSFVFYKMLNVMVQNLTVTKKSSSFNNINDTMEGHLLFQKYLNTCSLSSIAESSGDKKWTKRKHYFCDVHSPECKDRKELISD